tara:strand:- start:2594 stop:3139 length:546 start_codon:yes stop_codon:yes gene_type:complete
MDLKELNDNIKQEQAFEEMMKEKYPDGYTPAQEAAEWGKRNRSDLGLWMENKKKGLYNMIFGGDKGAHSAIDSKISKNNLNKGNIKNQLDANTLDVYGLFEDWLFNQGTAIVKGQTMGGEDRFYKRGFSMPSTYGDISDDNVTKDQIMQLLLNSIRETPDDSVSSQSVKDFYKLHKMPMPK